MILLALVVKTKIPDLPFLHYAIKNLFFSDSLRIPTKRHHIGDLS